MRYVHMNGRQLESSGMGLGSLNMPWFSYCVSCLCSLCNYSDQSFCCFKILRVSFAHFLLDASVCTFGIILSRYLRCLSLRSSIESFMFWRCSLMIFNWSWKRIGTPFCGCMAVFSITPKRKGTDCSLLLRAALMALRMSSRLVMSVILIDIGKECLRDEHHRGIRPSIVELAQFMSCRQWPSSILSLNSSPRVGWEPLVSISMST